MHPIKLLLFLAFSFLLLGCGNKESVDVKTKDIQVKAFVTDYSYLIDELGSGLIEVNVTLREDDYLDSVLYLVDGEYLSASYNGATSVTLIEETRNKGVIPSPVGLLPVSDAMNHFSYNAQIATDGGTGDLTITLHRQDGSQIPMTIGLLKPIELISPELGSEYTEYQDIELKWADSFWLDTTLGLKSFLSCSRYSLENTNSRGDVEVSSIIELPDDGYHLFSVSDLVTISRNKFEAENYGYENNECSLNIWLERNRRVSLAETFSKKSFLIMSQGKQIYGTVKLSD